MSLSTHILFSLVLLLTPVSVMAAQHALLIGVSDYTDRRITDLEGPINDVEALQSVLVRYWQFDPAAITTLVNEQATERAVLDALDALLTRTRPGDDVIIYFSGHGTSARDPDLGARLNLPDGSGAIVTSDFDPSRLRPQAMTGAYDDGLLIGRHELKPRFEALDQERNVLIMFDACFSGNSARAVSSAYTPSNRRQLSLLGGFNALLGKDDSAQAGTASTSDTLPQDNVLADRSQATREDERFEYANTVYFGAAAEDQFAVDFSQSEIDAGLVSSIDGKPHGGFTDSLLRVLSAPQSTQARDGKLSYALLFNRVMNEFATHCAVCGHTPVSLPIIHEDKYQLLNRAILSATPDLFLDTQYQAVTEPDTVGLPPDALIVDTDAVSDNALQVAQLLPARAVRRDSVKGQNTPDVYFEREEQALLARAADGHLITRFELDVPQQTLQAWLASRQWLKTRASHDSVREQGSLRVEFRHPLYGNQVSEGDFIHFTVSSELDVLLLAFVMDSKGALSVLYPVDTREAQAVLPANTPHRIPAIDQLQIQVTPPFGSDSVLFYALPVSTANDGATNAGASSAEHDTFVRDVLALAEQSHIALDDARLVRLEQLLDSGTLPYSASTVRIVAHAGP